MKCITVSTHTVDGVKKAKPNRITTAVYGIGGEYDNLSTSRIKCSCACEAYTFWGGEYALWLRGASDILYGNGDPPIVRNPRYRPWACVAKGTMITTDHGMVPIEQVFIGTRVLTLDGYRRVSIVGCTGANRATLVFSTFNGYYIEVTPEHLMYVVRLGRPLAEWVEASSINVGDYLVRVSVSSLWKRAFRALKRMAFGSKNSVASLVGRGDILMEAVSAIRPGISDVYDLSVPGPEHFIANGFVTHNCKHLIGVLRYILAKKL